MLHRIPILPSLFTGICEGAILGYLALRNGSAFIASLFSDEDWAKMSGPHGVAFISVIAVIVLWGNGLRRERNEERRRTMEESKRDSRHKESLGLQRESSDKLIELTVQSIQSQGATAAALTELTNTLDGRPCGLAGIEQFPYGRHPRPSPQHKTEPKPEPK